MASVFVFEYITGGGMLSADDRQVPSGSLLREGAAMVSALSTDFQRAGFDVVVQRDARLNVNIFQDSGRGSVRSVRSTLQEREIFERSVATTDWTVLIAPETNNALLDRSLVAVSSGARLMSPAPDFIAIAADKSRTCKMLIEHGVPVPAAVDLAAGVPMPSDFSYPAVRKPLDGAGSCDVELVSHAQAKPMSCPSRLERFYSGIPASVAFLCGPGLALPLPACRQRLGVPPAFDYLGGETPLPAGLAHRAQRLAMDAVAALPETTGYVGIDLILGEDPDGADDVVIEVNPRLTTSYVGLRANCRGNLAAFMACVSQGQPCDASFDDRHIVFDADGRLP